MANEVATRQRIEDPFSTDDWSAFDAPTGVATMPQASQGNSDAMMVQVMRLSRTHPRKMTEVRRRISASAKIMGDELRYSWFVNDRRSGGKTEISGPTIKCAQMVAREFGNCTASVRLSGETTTHWLFTGIFVDSETGYILTRDFQQRKSQDTGMKDVDRQADIVFQIGQSKALRNVIVNALSFYVDFALEEAKSVLLERVNNDPKAAKEKIVEIAAALGIDIKVLQGARGRVLANWTVADIALSFTELRGIQDGMTTIEDVYGDPDTAKGRADADEAERGANRAAAKEKVDGRTREAKKAKQQAEAGHEPQQDEQDAKGQPVGDAGNAGAQATQGAEGKEAANQAAGREEIQRADVRSAPVQEAERDPAPAAAPAEPKPAPKEDPPRPPLFGDRDQ